MEAPWFDIRDASWHVQIRLEQCGFQYVLFRKFSWYRQKWMATNFSCHCVSYWTRKRKFEQLERHLLSGLIGEENLRPPSNAASLDDIWLYKKLISSRVDLDNLQDVDANVIFCVAGYFGRSVCRQLHCFSCKSSLVVDGNFPPTELFTFELFIYAIFKNWSLSLLESNQLAFARSFTIVFFVLFMLHWM